MTTFIVLYTDKYQHESCEDCSCGFNHELKGVYTSFINAEKAILTHITKWPAFKKEDFAIKEIIANRPLSYYS